MSNHDEYCERNGPEQMFCGCSDRKELNTLRAENATLKQEVFRMKEGWSRDKFELNGQTALAEFMTAKNLTLRELVREEASILRELVREAKDGLNWNREQDWYKRAEKALGD